MNYLIRGFITSILICFLIGGNAQQFTPPVNQPNYNRPKLFSDLPDTILFPASLLSVIINLKEGQNTNINISAKFPFPGTVTSITDKYNSTIKSVIIKSTNRPGAGFTLSQTTEPEGMVSYNGRILSFQSGDGFELQYNDGKYYLIKRNFYDMVND
jgi:hypothetical protein